jgi:CTP:molybdopterin cytidylyltransferase MocA
VTVAAVILAVSPASALTPAAGRASARRIAEIAWAGGAMPIIVVAADPDGGVGRALAGSEATLVPPAPPERGAAGQLVRGMRTALDLVGGTDAALLWPVEMTWVDAETVTMLLQAHGTDPVACRRPTWDGRDGWPVLVPMAHLESLAATSADRSPEELLTDLEADGVPVRRHALGDPGSVLDRDTPIDALPPYDGPTAPIATPPDWGSAAADAPDDGPLDVVRRLDPADGA